MPHAIIVIALACLLFLGGGRADAAGTASPSSFTVVRGQASTVVVTYVFSSAAAAPTISVTSASGVFLANGTIIGRVSQPLTVVAQRGAGTVSETIVVPVAVMERALQLGVRTFVYSRSFAFPATLIPLNTQFTIGSEATATFAVRRMEVYFGNHRAETTVQKDFANLKAFADVNFVGSGLLQGYWEVDGRILARVSEHLSFGRSVTIPTPDIPSLPTFDPGTHTVRFVVTSPSYGIPLPAIVYFVTPDASPAAPRPVSLISPTDRQSIPTGPVTFTWEKLTGTALYLVQFFAKPDGKPVFSAYARDPMYIMPVVVWDEVFQLQQAYYWKVIGFDQENRTIGESAVGTFVVAAP